MKFYRKLHCPVGLKNSLLTTVCVTFVRFYFASILRAFFLFVVQVPEELEGTDENGLVDGIIPPQPKERFPNC
jgi:hypothetical protein